MDAIDTSLQLDTVHVSQALLLEHLGARLDAQARTIHALAGQIDDLVAWVNHDRTMLLDTLEKSQAIVKELHAKVVDQNRRSRSMTIRIGILDESVTAHAGSLTDLLGAVQDLQTLTTPLRKAQTWRGEV